jgi:hypothetical protein
MKQLSQCNSLVGRSGYSQINGLEEKRAQLEKNALEREEVALELESAQDGMENGTDRYAQTSKFVRYAVNQLDQEPTTLTVYKLSLIESAIQRLVLWSETRLVEESEVAQLVNDFEQAKERIAEKLSENVLAELRRENDKLPNDGNYQDQINARIAFQKAILKRMPEVSSSTAKEEAEKMIADNQATLEALSKNQVTAYNDWAIEQIVKFYNDNKAQLKITKNTDEKKLADEIYRQLGPINVGLLQMAAQVGYQEVFNLFYQELDQDQKIDLTRKMVVEVEKKALSDMPIGKTE